MDPRAQDLLRCDLCETAIVHSYCDICHVNLCKACIVDHISDEYDKHKIVPITKRRSTLIFPKCRVHPDKSCEFQCKNCDVLVCPPCMASKEHKGHTFVEVTEVYKTKKEALVKDAEELKNHISPKYEEIAADLENQIANLDKGYGKITTEISRQGQDWHREIDEIVRKMNSDISEIKAQHKSILLKHLEEVKQTQTLIKETSLLLKEIKQSTKISETFDYISRLGEFSKFPSKVKESLPKFIPNPKYQEKMCSLFGKITSPSSTEPNSVEKPLIKPEIVATVETGFEHLRNVICLKNDCIWTSGVINDFRCFNINGSLINTVQTESGKRPNHIVIDCEGSLLYTSGATGTVNRIKNGQSEEVMKFLGWRPINMCVTSFLDLLVTMCSNDETQSKVVRYSGSGYTEKQAIQFDEEGSPLFSQTFEIKYITENVNHDICVADYTSRAVVVVSQAGKLRWRYHGQSCTPNNKPFVPHGIASDSQGRILIADGDNNCINILDQNGQFLRYIDNCDLEEPYGLFLDSDDNLYVCEYYKGNVKKIKYSE